MKWCVTFDAVARCAKWVLCGVVMCVGFAMAGQMDYEDHVLTEMKNNGSYGAMVNAHPDWSEHELVEAYVARRDGVCGN